MLPVVQRFQILRPSTLPRLLLALKLQCLPDGRHCSFLWASHRITKTIYRCGAFLYDLDVKRNFTFFLDFHFYSYFSYQK
jgi:hypothetical protein